MIRKKIRKIIREKMYKIDADRRKNRLEKHVITELQKSEDIELHGMMEYIKKNGLSYFNYQFAEKYINMDINVYCDEENDMKYVLYKGKRMYFKRGWNEERIEAYCRSIFMEQDLRSPHRYSDEELKNRSYRGVIDAGVAEGSFGLEWIDKCEKMYLCECDDQWIEALELTFAPWKEKVYIYKAYISDNNTETEMSIDAICKDNATIDLIKFDIEGGEIKAAKGAENTLCLNPQAVLLVCVYHYQDEEKEICDFFQEYKIEPREGYMVFVHDKHQKIPYIRRGVLKIRKC